jgi:hypothetical protein
MKVKEKKKKKKKRKKLSWALPNQVSWGLIGWIGLRPI